VIRPVYVGLHNVSQTSRDTQDFNLTISEHRPQQMTEFQKFTTDNVMWLILSKAVYVSTYVCMFLYNMSSYLALRTWSRAANYHKSSKKKPALPASTKTNWHWKRSGMGQQRPVQILSRRQRYLLHLQAFSTKLNKYNSAWKIHPGISDKAYCRAWRASDYCLDPLDLSQFHCAVLETRFDWLPGIYRGQASISEIL